MVNTILLVWYLAAGIGVASGDVLLAQWVRTGRIVMMPVGLLLNVIGILCYTQTLQYEHIGISTAIFLGLNIILVAIIGAILFDEQLGLMRIIGFVLMIGAIGLLEI